MLLCSSCMTHMLRRSFFYSSETDELQLPEPEPEALDPTVFNHKPLASRMKHNTVRPETKSLARAKGDTWKASVRRLRVTGSSCPIEARSHPKSAESDSHQRTHEHVVHPPIHSSFAGGSADGERKTVSVSELREPTLTSPVLSELVTSLHSVMRYQ